MKKKVLLPLLCLFSCVTHAQTGAFVIGNSMNCDIQVDVYASDAGGTYSSSCDFGSNTINVAAWSSSTSCSDYCNFQSVYGWSYSPGPMPCPYGTPDPNFRYTDVKVAVITCYSGYPWYSGPAGGLYVHDVAATCSYPSSVASPGSFGPGTPTIYFIEGGSFPRNVQIIVN